MNLPSSNCSSFSDCYDVTHKVKGLQAELVIILQICYLNLASVISAKYTSGW